MDKSNINNSLLCTIYSVFIEYEKHLWISRYSHFLVKVTCLFLIGFYQVSVLAMVFLGMPYVVEAIKGE